MEIHTESDGYKLPRSSHRGPAPLPHELSEWSHCASGEQIGWVCRVPNVTDLKQLSVAVQYVVLRQDALRMTFGLPAAPGAPLTISELDFCDRADGAELARQYVRSSLSTAFNLCAGPPWVFQVIRPAADVCYWVFRCHRLVADEYATQLILRELLSACHQLSAGQALAPLPGPSYRQWLDEQSTYRNSGAFLEDQNFWRARLLKSVVPLFRANVHASGRSETHATVWSTLGSVWSRLKSLALSVGCTSSDFLLTAVAVCLSRTRLIEDGIMIGLICLNRNTPQRCSMVGVLESVVPLRVRVDDAADFVANMQRVAAERRTALQHARFPISVPAGEDGWTRPKLDVLLRVDAGDETVSWGGVETVSFFSSGTRAPLSLTLRCGDGDSDGAHMSLMFRGDCRFLAAEELGRVRSQFDLLSRSVLASAKCPVGKLPIMSDAERRQVLFDWNSATHAQPEDLCVHERFERHAQLTPLAVAAEQGELTLSYRDLNERANRLARHLRHMGVGPDDRVAICMPHCFDLLVAMLAVAKSGGAYVLLDPAQPLERRDLIMVDSDARALLTLEGSYEQSPRLPELPVLLLDGAPCPWVRRSPRNLPPARLKSNRLVYVIYTSGSTGELRGVMVEHRNLANLVTSSVDTLRTRPGERASCMAGVAFDVLGGEVWHGLCAGATLVIPPPQALGDPAKLLDWWSRQELDVSVVGSALAEAAMSRALPTGRLRVLLTAGDGLSRPPGEDVPFEVVNVYGPAETTVASTMGRIRPWDQVIHVGRPIANARIYLLDSHGQPVPVGVAGEIHIAGAGVARGYLNQPQLTRERFLEDPFSGESGARMYKTGNLGRWLPEGTLEFLKGRVQVLGVTRLIT